MDFTNLSDPALVKALLESLKGSQVWNGSEPLPIPDAGSTSGTEPASVASLLSQLQSSSSSASAAPGVEVNSASDIRSLTYQQSLPLLSRLSEDNPAFTKALTSLKIKQDALERQLWQEREAIHDSYRAKITAAKTRASIIGVGISQHDADMLSESYRKELAKFDTERALFAWNALVTKQQETLAALGTPTMFVTSAPEDRERQQKVMRALEGMLD